ncbi:MAG: DUF4062 domain-containing protein [Fusobacteriaceae bacterium]|nr:DUF4062 domain-containing protein [Fusobacteriaceae bacterium]
MKNTKYQVFISSTYSDLSIERKQVLDILLMADCIPAGMESFVATDEEQFNVIKKVIDLCDYYIPKFIGFMRLRAIAFPADIQWRQWHLPVYASICCKGETLLQTEGQSRLCYPLLFSCYSRFSWASAAFISACTQYQMSSLPTVWAIWFLLSQRK